MALTERSHIEQIRVLASGSIEVDRAAQVLRDDDVVSSITTTQVLQPGLDLAQFELEPAVLAVAAAVWSPELVQQRADALLHQVQSAHQALQAAEQAMDAERTAQTTRQLQADADALEGLAKSRQAVQAAQQELAAEQAVLAERSEQIATRRAALVKERDELSQQP